MAWNPLKSDNDSEKDPTQPDASAAAPQQEARILDATGVDPEAGQRPEASEVDDGEQAHALAMMHLARSLRGPGRSQPAISLRPSSRSHRPSGLSSPAPFR